MPRRRRRRSDSTVASVDDKSIRWLKETQVLKPVSKEDHPDAWPCFVLTDAIIYSKDGRSMANALHAAFDGPFVVRGHFEAEEDSLASLVRPSVKSTYMEIPASSTYSIGYGPNAVLWVAGECGWFEINPAPQYKAIYGKMCEGITLYYKIMEVYETEKADKTRKTPREFSHQQLCLRYAVAVGDGAVYEEVDKRCHDHAQFLIAHFAKEENFKWKSTPFFRYMTAQHPEIVKRLKDLAAGVAPKRESSAKSKQAATPKVAAPTKPARNTKASPTNSDVEMPDIMSLPTMSKSAQAAQRSVPSKAKPPGLPSRSVLAHTKTNASPEASGPTDTELAASESQPAHASPLYTASTVDTLKALLTDIAQDTEPAKTTVSNLSNRIHMKCKIRTYGAAREILTYYAKPLFNDLPSMWKGTQVQAWLEEISKKPYTPPAMIMPEEMPVQLIRRQKKAMPPVRSAAAAGALPREVLRLPKRPEESSEDDEELTDERPKLHQPRGSKRLHPAQLGRRSGKIPGLRLASKPLKRATDRMDLDDDAEQSQSSGRRGRKSAKTSHHWTEDEDEESGRATSLLEDDDDTDTDEELEDPRPAKETVRIVVQAERVPTMSPAGPNKTWVCSEPDCGYVVRGADDDEGQQVIQEHFREHEEQASKINLAVAEGRRGHMPINHLLEKIQNMGKKSLLSDDFPATDDSDTKYPMPIKRRVFI